MSDSAREMVKIDLQGCARCLGDGHPGLVFEKLDHPVEFNGEIAATHWAECPTSGEPILMRQVELG